MKTGFLLQIVSQKDRLQTEKKKFVGLMKDNLGAKIIKELMWDQEQKHTVI